VLRIGRNLVNASNSPEADRMPKMWGQQEGKIEKRERAQTHGTETPGKVGDAAAGGKDLGEPLQTDASSSLGRGGVLGRFRFQAENSVLMD